MNSLFCEMAAVVTTFDPAPSIVRNLRRIAAQVGQVIVVDDSGRGAAIPLVESTELANLVVLVNEQNLGIATALNRGVAEAAERGCRWVITLDDDTLVSERYVQDVFDFINRHPEMAVGVVACGRQREGGGNAAGEQDEDMPFREKRNLITSGCVFEIATYSAIGGFDERMFIDLVDFDFCIRLRKSGRKVIELERVGMMHMVGASRTSRLLGFALTVYNHAPFRLYYQARNAILFAGKHWRFDPLLCSVLLLDLVRLPLKAIAFESEKLRRLRYVVAGGLDGLRGRGGRVPYLF